MNQPADRLDLLSQFCQCWRCGMIALDNSVIGTTLLSCELVGPIANSAVGCALWYRPTFSDTNASTIFP